MRRLWQVSVATSAGEDAVARLLSEAFGAPAAAYCHEKTGAVTVSVYPERLAVTRAELTRRLRALGESGAVRIKPLRRENWAESWKRHFHPLDIDGRILVKPGWSRRRPRRGQAVVILDPGLSFGTGHHPTTFFCLRELARRRRAGLSQSFLDIGAGSGILAIAAARIGYGPVQAWEYDPEAIRAARQNLTGNGVGRRVRLRRVDLRAAPLEARKRYDVVCANLMADLLLAEALKIRNLIVPAGFLVVAGILREEFESIQKKLQNLGLTFLRSRIDKEWKSGVFTLKK